MEASRINPQAASQRILELQLFTTLPDKDADQDTMNEVVFGFLLFSIRRESDSGLIMTFFKKQSSLFVRI